MKRNILFLLIMVISAVAYGQKKPKINNALKAAEEGNLTEAKEIIDAAIVHEKTKDDAKTWYYRGLIYAAIDTTNSISIDKDALAVSMEAFNKATALNEGKGELFTSGPNGLVLQSQQLNTIWGHYLNKGVTAFQEENPEEALKNFTRCQMVMPEDTVCYLYAGLAAQMMEDYETASKNYYTLINDLDNHDQDVYNSLIYIESTINKNYEKALELVRAAKQKWPQNTDFAKSEISLLINLNKVDEAKEELLAAIENEPTNPDLLFTLGVLKDETGDTTGAVEAYKKALEVDPNHYNSAFNLAVLKFNEARGNISKRNSLGMSSADRKKSAEYDKLINQQLKENLPMWERVRSIKPSDRTALEQLRYIYVSLKQNDKAEEIQKELDKYGYKDGE